MEEHTNLDLDFIDFCSAPFNKTISIHNYVVKWSRNNKISVNQRKYIVVLGLQLNIPQILLKTSYERCILKVPEQYPTEKTNVDIGRLLYDLKKRSVFTTLFDPLLAPRLDKCKPIQPEFVFTCWSSENLVNNDTCALATLTNLGFVTIYIHQQHTFTVLGNINEFWEREVKKNWFSIARKRISRLQAIHKMRAYELHISCIAWSPYENGFCYLVTGHSSGDVAIWKIDKIIYEDPIFQPEFIIRIKQFNVCVSCLHWFKFRNKDYLIIGYANGKVVGYIFSDRSDSISEMKIIWPDEDNINVNCIKVTKFYQFVTVLIIKQSYLIAVLLDDDLNILHTTNTSIGSYYITGIKRTLDNEFILASISGEITNIKVNLTIQNKIELEQKQLKILMDTENYGVFGIACSRTKAIWAFFLSPVKNYDHLSLKQPSLIKFCTSKRFDAIEILKNNPTKLLTNYWDCMDFLRYTALKQKSLLEWPYYSNSISIYETKILYWLSSELHNVIKRQARPVPFDITFTKRLFDEIMIANVIDTFNALVKVHSCGSLNEFDLKTLRNCRDFLKHYIKSESEESEMVGNNLYSKIIKAYGDAVKIEFDFPPEKCSWCEENLIDLKCPNDHQFSSCMISLLPISELDYLMCPNCEKIARKELLATEPICVFCDVKLIKQK